MRTIAVAAVFVVAFAVRWATLPNLGGDDHWSLWTAPMVLKGDLPFRDFADVGNPLSLGISTFVQWLVGYRVVGEVMLATALMAFAFALAFHMAWQASGSARIATLLVGMALLLLPINKLYSYPKIFVYPLGLWLSWRYIDRPTLRRAIMLAIGVVIAWGYRHDHGAYVGVGAAAAILAAHWPEGPRRVITGWARFGAALLILLAPYLILIQVNEGVVQYVRARIDIARQLDEAGRRLVWFSVDRTASPHWLRIDPPRPARVQVDWKPEVTREVRVALEKQYALTNAVDPKTRLYEYFLTDVSRENLTALVGDARIADRRGISASYRETPGGAKALREILATDPAPPSAPPGARATVEIQWSSAVGEAERAALERKYGLLDSTPDRSRWEYALTDVTTGNIRAIVEDPHVYDTGLIERDIYRPMEESWLIRLQRTVPLLRISIAPRYWHELNAGVWLYYVSFALPVIILIVLALDRIRGTDRRGFPHAGPKMFAAAVMMAAVNLALMRKLGYVSDHAQVAAILGAWITGQAWAGIGRPVTAFLAQCATVVILLVSAFATITHVSPLSSMAAAGLNNGLPGAWDKSVRAFREYAASPPIDGYAPRGTTGDRGVLRYIYECTRPDDRIWLLSDTSTVPYYTERRVVGHLYWGMGFLSTDEYQRRMIARVDAQEVPLIVSFGGHRPLEYLESYEILHEYAARRYTDHHAIPEDSVGRDSSIWLLTDGRRKPTGMYELLGLPCFK
jgi:hypothetical protein